MPERNDPNQQNENVRDPKRKDEQGGGMNRENTPGTPGAQNYGQTGEKEQGINEPSKTGKTGVNEPGKGDQSTRQGKGTQQGQGIENQPQRGTHQGEPKRDQEDDVQGRDC